MPSEYFHIPFDDLVETLDREGYAAITPSGGDYHLPGPKGFEWVLSAASGFPIELRHASTVTTDNVDEEMQLDVYAALLRAKAELEYVDRIFAAAFGHSEPPDSDDFDLYRETPTTSPFLDMVPRSQSSHSDKTAASGSKNTPPAPQHPDDLTEKMLRLRQGPQVPLGEMTREFLSGGDFDRRRREAEAVWIAEVRQLLYQLTVSEQP